jgi:hypothetical protein
MSVLKDQTRKGCHMVRVIIQGWDIGVCFSSRFKKKIAVFDGNFFQSLQAVS